MWDIWQLIDFLWRHAVLFGLIAITVACFYILFKVAHGQRRRRQLFEEEHQRLLLERQGQEQSPRTDLPQQQIARLEALRAESRRRQEEERRQAEEANRQAEMEQAAMDEALLAWARAEEDSSQRSESEETEWERRRQRQLQEEIAALDAELANWEASQLVSRRSGKAPAPVAASNAIHPSHREVQHIRHEVEKAGAEADREAEDFDYLLNKVETGVDFLPLQVNNTITRWKMVEVNRHCTFEDLKRKFRYQAYSIEDGLEVYYLYEQWIENQRRQLFDFVERLGHRPQREEPLTALLDRAEEIEWHKGLAINMDAIESFREIRRIDAIINSIEKHLVRLADACRRRSKLIIEPDWEPKGIL